MDAAWQPTALSAVLANIFMVKVEADVVRPFNPPFYDRSVDDCFSKKKKDKPDALYERLNRLDTTFSYTNKFNWQRLQETGETTNTLEIGGPYQVEKELHHWRTP